MNENTKFKSWNPIKNEWYFPDHNISPIFIKNTNDVIDWEKLILELSDKTGAILPKFIWHNPHFEEMKKLYTDSDYLLYSAEWINYYPERDFDKEWVTKFGNAIGHPRYARAWVSKIEPGKTAPWHWDLDDYELEYIKDGELVRFMCKMNPGGVGQVTILGNHVVKAEQGDVFQWPDYRMWHGSVNCGLTPKY